MYIREVIKMNRGSEKEYKYHRLIESYRGPNGPRQRTVLELGTLELEPEQLSDLANRIEEHLTGQGPRLVPLSQEVEDLARHFAGLIIKKQVEQTPAEPEDATVFQSVDVASIETSHPKSVGGEHVGLAAMNALNFRVFFKPMASRKARPPSPHCSLSAGSSTRAQSASSSASLKTTAHWICS